MNYITRDDYLIIQGNKPPDNNLLDIITKYNKIKTSVAYDYPLDNLPTNITDIEFDVYFN